MNNKEFKVFKPCKFTVMPNTNLMDDTLSLKAIGLLSKMLNLPDNWDYSLKGLVAISKENYDTIRSILNELKEHNYIEIIKSRKENGTFKYNYLIFMNLVQKAQIMWNYSDGKNPYVNEPDMESSTQYNMNKYIDKNDKYGKTNLKHNFLTSSLINCEKYEKTVSNPQEKRMTLIEKYESKLEDAKNRALEEVIKIEEYINKIKDSETRMIFRYRYIEFKKWNEIPRLINLSRSIVFDRHQSQLNMINN